MDNIGGLSRKHTCIFIFVSKATPSNSPLNTGQMASVSRCFKSDGNTCVHRNTPAGRLEPKVLSGCPSCVARRWPLLSVCLLELNWGGFKIRFIIDHFPRLQWIPMSEAGRGNISPIVCLPHLSTPSVRLGMNGGRDEV